MQYYYYFSLGDIKRQKFHGDERVNYGRIKRKARFQGAQERTLT